MHHQFRCRFRISLRSTRATAFSKNNAYIRVDSVCIDWRRSRIIVAPIRNPGEDIGHQSQRCPVQRGSRPRRGEFQEEGAKAMTEYQASGKVIRERMAQLKALRLAKEAAEKGRDG
jgi:hypothetical protein